MSDAIAGPDTLFKVLDGKKPRYGTGTWKRVGAWMPPVEGELVACENGYHLARGEQVLDWLGRPTIYAAEHRGELIEAGNKIVVREARLVHRFDAWDERAARLFAADCAEDVLHLFESARPDDDRPRKAIEAARAFATGEISAAASAASAADAYAAYRAAYRAHAASAAAYAAYRAADAAAAYAAYRAADAASAAAAAHIAGVHAAAAAAYAASADDHAASYCAAYRAHASDASADASAAARARQFVRLCATLNAGEHTDE